MSLQDSVSQKTLVKVSKRKIPLLPATPERIAYNDKMRKIMAERRPFEIEKKAAGFLGSVNQWKAHKASLLPGNES